MLARISAGKSGIADYLKDGLKQGRELSRDKLDSRIVIDGNLSITDNLIKQLAETKSQDSNSDNYYHITLSFSERDLTDELIKSAYEDYKKYLMNAYDSTEYNIYAEIHKPKIKSYICNKTGEEIERLPHVHIVIPKTNLVNNLNLNPFGYYKGMIDHHDAIQEKINRTYNLESPYDKQREHAVYKSDILSRYKGDDFVGANKDIKNEILNKIHKENIRDINSFEKVLSTFGDVDKGNSGKGNEYYKLKPKGYNKFIRLKEPCFNKDYIYNRILKRDKPSDRKVNKLLDDWIYERSYFNKYVHSASKKDRDLFNKLSNTEKKEYLDDQRKQFESKYIQSSRSKTNQFTGTQRVERSELRTFADQNHSMPSMLLGNVADDRGDRQTQHERDSFESVLSNHESLHLVDKSQRAIASHGELRRSDVRRGIIDDGLVKQLATKSALWTHDHNDSFGAIKDLERVETDFNQSISSSDSVSSHYLNQHLLFSHAKIYDRANQVNSRELLDALNNQYGLIKQHYHSLFLNGEALIAVNGNVYNHSDFLKHHMALSPSEAEAVVTEAKQTLKDDQIAFNQIISGFKEVGSFESDFYNTFEALSKLKMEERTMNKQQEYTDNSFFGSDTISLKNVYDNLERQQQLADQLTSKYSELITKTVKDSKSKIKKIDFHNANGDKLFTDHGSEIRVNKKNNDYDTTAMALELAVEKFGKVNIRGTKEFKQQCIDVAIAKDLKVIFADKNMQQEFLHQKEMYKQPQQQQPQQQQQQQAQDSEHQSYTFSYKYDLEKYAMAIRINDKLVPDSSIDQSLLAKIAKKDPFLKNIRLEDINSGFVSMQKVDTQPISKTYDQSAKVLSAAQLAKLQQTQQQAKPQVQQQVQTQQQQGDVLINHGRANYQFDKNEKPSYFAEFESGKVLWGVGIKDALSEKNIQVDDRIDLVVTGKEQVKVETNVYENGKIVKDANGDAVKKIINTERNVWQATKYEVQSQSENMSPSDNKEVFNFSYKYDHAQSKLAVLINDKLVPDSNIEQSLLAKIAQKDNFLKTLALKDIQSGFISLRDTSAQPKPKTYDQSASPVKTASAVQSASKTLIL